MGMSAEAIVAIFTLSGTIIVSSAGIFTLVWKTWKQTSSVNESINCRGPDQPKVIEILLDLHKGHSDVKEILLDLSRWRKSYRDSPWENGESVKAWLLIHDSLHERLEAKIDSLLPEDESRV